MKPVWLFLDRYPEVVPLAVNCLLFLRYARAWRTEPGKLLYWLGACLLTVGLLKMKG